MCPLPLGHPWNGRLEPRFGGAIFVGGRLAKKMPRRSGAVARRCPSRATLCRGSFGGIIFPDQISLATTASRK